MKPYETCFFRKCFFCKGEGKVDVIKISKKSSHYWWYDGVGQDRWECPKCGDDLIKYDDSKYCPACGVGLKWVE